MFFLWNQSVNTIYPNEENVFMVPNHEMKGDCNVNPRLSQLESELQFKKWMKEKCFLRNQKINSFILVWRMDLGCPIIKRMEIIMWIRVYPTEKQTLTQKWWKEMLLLWNQSMNIIYLSEENAFMMPNHEKKGDYYVKPCLSKSTNEHYF